MFLIVSDNILRKSKCNLTHTRTCTHNFCALHKLQIGQMLKKSGRSVIVHVQDYRAMFFHLVHKFHKQSHINRYTRLYIFSITILEN